MCGFLMYYLPDLHSSLGRSRILGHRPSSVAASPAHDIFSALKVGRKAAHGEIRTSALQLQ